MPACDMLMCMLHLAASPAPDEPLLHVSLSSLSDDQPKVISFLILRPHRTAVPVRHEYHVCAVLSHLSVIIFYNFGRFVSFAT